MADILMVVCLYATWRCIEALLTTNRYPSEGKRVFGIVVTALMLIVFGFFTLGAVLSSSISSGHASFNVTPEGR